MDFAPYQDTDPSTTRALSPPPSHKTRPLSPSPNARAHPPPSEPPYQSLPPPSNPSHLPHHHTSTAHLEDTSGSSSNRLTNISLFETSLPLRLDHEAMLAYLVLPPAGAALLLVLEHRSDYVRFHAWQSAMVFSVLFVAHLLLSWSALLSWMLFVLDLGVIGWGGWRAWRDADGLDRFEMPFFGGLASSFVDSE